MRRVARETMILRRAAGSAVYDAAVEVRVGHHGDGALVLFSGLLLREADAPVLGVG